MEKDEEVDIILETPDWYQFYAAEMGWGYSDNPMGAAHNTESSSFAELNLESFFLNQKNPQHQALIYLLAEGKNFYQLKSEEISGLILSQFEYTYKPTGEDHMDFNSSIPILIKGMDFSEQCNPPDPQRSPPNALNFPRISNGQETARERRKITTELEQGETTAISRSKYKFGISVSLSNQYAEPTKMAGKIIPHPHKVQTVNPGTVQETLFRVVSKPSTPDYRSN